MAAANTCLTAILMLVHHNHKSSIASFTETCDGLGYMIGWYLACVWEMSPMCNHTPIRIYLGPILGSYLYQCGGFALPFHVTGVLIIVFTICLCVVVPSGPRNKRDQKIKEETKALTVWEILKVHWKHLYSPTQEVFHKTSSGATFDSAFCWYWSYLLFPHWIILGAPLKELGSSSNSKSSWNGLLRNGNFLHDCVSNHRGGKWWQYCIEYVPNWN